MKTQIYPETILTILDSIIYASYTTPVAKRPRVLPTHQERVDRYESQCVGYQVFNGGERVISTFTPGYDHLTQTGKCAIA